MCAKIRERTICALVILQVCLISTAVLAEESYLCIGEQGTVFVFNKTNKTWTAENAKPGKWIVKRSTNPEYKWIIFEFGEKDAEKIPITCANDFYSNGDLFSDRGATEFRMNKNTMRYLIASLLGYWSYGEKSMYGDEGKLQPFMEIGKCSKIGQ